MKRAVFLISMVAIFLVSTTSCTTDEYDTADENSTIANENIVVNGDTVDSTQPIIIPKKD